jgi:uncharacterized membrane protein YqaE (UPF0057 family)
MGCGRALLCILFPPFAVLDVGCGTLALVTVLTLFGWVPGAIAALIVNLLTNQSARQHNNAR